MKHNFIVIILLLTILLSHISILVWSISSIFHFSLVQSTTVYFGAFGPFSPVHFTLAHLVLLVPFGPLRSSSVNLVHFGESWNVLQQAYGLLICVTTQLVNVSTLIQLTSNLVIFLSIVFFFVSSSLEN